MDPWIEHENEHGKWRLRFSSLGTLHAMPLDERAEEQVKRLTGFGGVAILPLAGDGAHQKLRQKVTANLAGHNDGSYRRFVS